MAQPDSWQSAQSYSTYATQHPSSPFPPAALDNDFANLKITIAQTLANLAVIQRDDTALANESVHPDALSTATLNLIGEWNPRGFWVAARLYAVRDMATVDTTSYVCAVYHLSDASFALDLARGYWQQVNGGGGGGGGIGDPVIGGTPGHILFVGPGPVLAQDDDLFWDNTAKRMGLGIMTPTQRLHVVGNAFITGELVANPGYANIKAFGGDPTGTADTKAAWDLAIAAGYRVIYFPKGDYKFLSGITEAGNITILGDGARVSRLFIAGAAGFDFLTWTGVYNQFTADQLSVRGISIGTECASGAAQGTAISATVTSPFTNWKQPVQGVSIRDVAITNDMDLACWAKGIYLDTIESPEVSDCFVSGFMTVGAGGSRSGIGIEIVSEFATNNNVKGTNPIVSNTIVYQCTTGITINNSADNLKNYVEGGHLQNVTALNCLTGIRIGSTVALSASGLPGWFIDNCHVTATDIGIDLATISQFFVRGNLIYSIGGTNFIGVKVTTDATPGLETDGIIAHNTIMNVGVYSGFTRGINVESGGATPATASIAIQTNRFGASGFTTAIYLGVNVSGVIVYPDNVVDTGGVYADFGSGNQFPLYETGSTLAIGDAVGGGTEGSVLFVGAGVLLAQDNANLFFNDTTNRLRVGPKGYLFSNSSNNYAFGENALAAVGGGAVKNIGIGTDALKVSTDGQNNIAIGYQTGIAMTNGIGNVIVGTSSGTSVAGGGENVIIGHFTGAFITGDDNVLLGPLSGNKITDGYANIFIGAGAHGGGSGNCAGSIGIGRNTLNTDNGTDNIGIGTIAGTAMTNGTDNTLVGKSSGSTITTGTFNTCFGSETSVSAATASNQTSLGYQAACTGNDQFTMGNSSVATLRCQQTSITALSDLRDKMEVMDLTLGLDFINTLRPVSFVWNARDGSQVGVKDCGFIAQELQAVDTDHARLVYAVNADRLEATPGRLIPMHTKAIQELSAQNLLLLARIEALERAL